MGTDYERLGVKIADYSYSFAAAEFGQVRLEFGAEIIVLNVVDGPLDP